MFTKLIIFDIEIRSAEIQFLARVHKLGLDRGAQSFPPKIRSRNVNLIARPARQTRALRLRNVRRRCFLRVQIRIARREDEIGNRLRTQLRFEPLRFSRAEVERLEKSVESDHVRQVIVKIGQANRHATAAQSSCLDANVPTQIVFRFQSEIVPENFVLTAWRTESGRHAGMQRRVRLVDLVTAGEPISPDTAELIEVIETSAGDKNQIFDLA